MRPTDRKSSVLTPRPLSHTFTVGLVKNTFFIIDSYDDIRLIRNRMLSAIWSQMFLHRYNYYGSTKIPNWTDFSVFNCWFLVFFGLPNTDIGIGIGFLKYRISVRYTDLLFVTVLCVGCPKKCAQCEPLLPALGNEQDHKVVAQCAGIEVPTVSHPPPLPCAQVVQRRLLQMECVKQPPTN